TGDFFSAADARRYGLVNALTAPGEAMAGARALAARIPANGPLAVAATKEIITKAADWTFEEGWDGQQAILGPVFASQDAREGARAFAEKRAPQWTGRLSAVPPTPSPEVPLTDADLAGLPALVHGQTFEEMVVGSRFRTA